MGRGVLGEAKALAHFVEAGYDVFVQFDGKSPFDLVVHKAGELKRVSVKTTSTLARDSEKWSVQLKSVRPNRSESKLVYFDTSSCDLLAVYIEPEDRLVVLEASEVLTKTEMRVA